MIVKNSAGKRREVVFRMFFPATRPQIEKLLAFIADNHSKRDVYFTVIMRYLTETYIATGCGIEGLYAERRAKSDKLRCIRREQAALTNTWWPAHNHRKEYLAGLEDAAQQSKRRQRRITAELFEVKLRSNRLEQNIKWMTEVKPW